MKSVRLALCALAAVLAMSTRSRAAEDASGGARATDNTLVYVGTYTGAQQGKGIYLFKLQTSGLEVSQNITLVPLGLAVETASPSFLALDAKRQLMFAVNEVNEFEGQKAGSVSSFRIDAATGKLVELSRKSSKGGGPCHLVLDKEGKHVIAANYNGGSVVVLPVDNDGKLGDATDFVQHAGHSVDPQRQEGPHAHCVTLSPDGKFVFVCDLGLDQVLCYRYDSALGKLTPNDPAFTPLTPGTGPRHMVFHPNGKFAYVNGEMKSTVTAFAFDAEKGALRELQTLSTLPPYYDGPNSTAEIGMTPSGKYLYVSNRGHESVVLFEVNPDDGTLTFVEEQGTGGKKPRNFGIQPTGAHLVIANQDSNNLLVCRIDDGNGRLKPSGVFAEAPSPVCVVFLQPQKSGK